MQSDISSAPPLTVCILAAGLGSRAAGHDQGLHKALLPLANMAVISHIINQFAANSRFVVAVGHAASQIQDYLTAAHPRTDITFVPVDRITGPGAGPAYSLLCCQPYLIGPFIFTACDTLVRADIPPLTRNWVGVCPTDDPVRWCTVHTNDDGAVRSLHYKTVDGGPLSFIGIAGIVDHTPFWTGLRQAVAVDGESQVNGGLEALIAPGLFAAHLPWLDVGDTQGYTAAVSQYGENYTFTGKTTEMTYRLGNRVIKLFTDPEVATRRAHRAQGMGDAIPQMVARHGHVYAYSFVDGIPLADALEPVRLSHFLDWIERTFWRPLNGQDPTFGAACEQFYGDKTTQRLHAFLTLMQWAAEPETLTINQTLCPTVAQLLAAPKAGWAAHGLPSTFHGDLHADNVIIADDADPSRPYVLIDWRQDFGGLTDKGDRYYDLAKFLHTLDLSVRTMTERAFSDSFDATAGTATLWHRPLPNADDLLTAFRRHIDGCGYDGWRIEFLNGLVFVNMAPLYDPELGRYLYLLGRLRMTQAMAGNRLAPAATVTTKPWGHEVLVGHNQHYALKDIVMIAGTRSSLQSHLYKHETILVLSGRIQLEIGPSVTTLEIREYGPGDSYTVYPGIIHRVTVLQDARLIEASTPELTDVVRHSDDYGRN